MKNSRIANNVAARFKRAYLTVKLPINYAIVVNCKKFLEDRDISVDDEILVEILSRYLDLVIYGLCNGNTPSEDDLTQVATEVVDEYNDDDYLDDDFQDDFEEERF